MGQEAAEGRVMDLSDEALAELEQWLACYARYAQWP